MGRRRQRGHGIGNVISGAFRSLLPAASNIFSSIAKKALPNLGKHALQAGINIAGDVLGGMRAKDALQQRAVQVARNPASLVRFMQHPPEEPPKKKRKKTIKSVPSKTGHSKLTKAKKGRRTQKRPHDIFDD